jgi:uncharacterized zinc-type alcohol dehydrogenase-like protein
MEIHAQAALEKGAALTPFHYSAPSDLGPHELEIEITHCGICHSDIHLIDNDWGISRYPLIPGHEIIGHVIRTGRDVSLKQGTRVGVGWQRSSCLECDECISGRENLCLKQEATCNGHPGGFAERIIVDARFAFPIPDSLDSENAAPLLCAGITVYTPMQHFGVRPGKKVGVIGIGGLGHLAIQFARAMGCEVTAFSSSPDKEAETKSSGAHHFVLLTKENLRSLRRSQDFILNTAMVEQDWHSVIQMLRSDGHLCFVGVPARPLNLPVHLLLDGRRSISGSNIGGRNDMREMLHFAALNGIKARTETMPLTSVNEALKKVRENRARYRMVLTMQ